MTYFVMDAESVEAFGAGLRPFETMRLPPFRILEYSRLLDRPSLPFGTYLFLDLMRAGPAKRSLAGVVQKQLQTAGASVFGAVRPLPKYFPTYADEFDGLRLPSALRAKFSHGSVETLPIEKPDEFARAAIEFLLLGYEPSDIEGLGSLDGEGSIASALRIGQRWLRLRQARKSHHRSKVFATDAQNSPMLDVVLPDLCWVDYRFAGDKASLWDVSDAASEFWPQLPQGKRSAFLEELRCLLETGQNASSGDIRLEISPDAIQRVMLESSVK